MDAFIFELEVCEVGAAATASKSVTADLASPQRPQTTSSVARESPETLKPAETPGP